MLCPFLSYSDPGADIQMPLDLRTCSGAQISRPPIPVGDRYILVMPWSERGIKDTENVSGTSSNQLRVDTNKPSSFYQHLTMFFTRIATTVALAVALASAAPAPDLQKVALRCLDIHVVTDSSGVLQRQPNAFFCTDADFTGNCFLSTTAGCINVGAGFQDDVTSFGPDPGVFCNLFTYVEVFTPTRVVALKWVY